MSGQELKRCPFCGDPAELISWDAGHHREAVMHFVRCRKCLAKAGIMESDKEDAISWWNSRQIEIASELATENAELVARVKELEGALTKILALETRGLLWRDVILADDAFALCRSALAKKEG